MKKYKAILWDCDGVLIDSEHIACGISAAFFTEKGYPITTDDFIARFMGMSRPQIFQKIEEETGKSFEIFSNKTRAFEQLKAAFTKELKATPGIEDVLKTAGVPMAVASGSSAERLQFSLELTNLLGYFGGHVYSSEALPNGKPAPDIFLHAAKRLGVDPADCLVVEDGVHGIAAAQAAKMDVLVYTGATHMKPALKAKVLSLKPMAEVTRIGEVLDFLEGRRAA